MTPIVEIRDDTGRFWVLEVNQINYTVYAWTPADGGSISDKTKEYIDSIATIVEKWAKDV